MFNRSDILRAAWAGYRRAYADKPFSRNRFAMALRSAWNDAKTMAWALRRQAEDEARLAAATPEVVAAHDELVSLNMKDFWTAADAARYSALSAMQVAA